MPSGIFESRTWSSECSVTFMRDTAAANEELDYLDRCQQYCNDNGRHYERPPLRTAATTKHPATTKSMRQCQVEYLNHVRRRVSVTFNLLPPSGFRSNQHFIHSRRRSSLKNQKKPQVLADEHQERAILGCLVLTNRLIDPV